MTGVQTCALPIYSGIKISEDTLYFRAVANVACKVVCGAGILLGAVAMDAMADNPPPGQRLENRLDGVAMVNDER